MKDGKKWDLRKILNYDKSLHLKYRYVNTLERKI